MRDELRIKFPVAESESRVCRVFVGGYYKQSVHLYLDSLARNVVEVFAVQLSQVCATNSSTL